MNRIFTRTAIILSATILLAVVGITIALITLWNEKADLDRMVSDNVRNMVAASELDIALLRQRGLVASYILSNGEQDWLDDLERFQPMFRQRLDQLEQIADSDTERAILKEIGTAFNQYAAKRDEFVQRFEQGISKQERVRLLDELNARYQAVVQLCDEVVSVDRQGIDANLAAADKGIRRVTMIISASVVLTAILGISLIWLLFRQVFKPLQRIGDQVQEFSLKEGLKQTTFDQDPAAIQYYLKSLMTEFSEVRSNLEASRRELRHQERLAAIGKVMAHISHEIRNSVAVVGGFSKSLAKKPERTDLVKEYTGIINQEVERMERMLTDVMRYSKPVKVEKQRLPLNDVVSRAIHTFSHQIPSDVKITVNLDPSNPMVALDPGPITQVILNLIKNSIEALDKGGEIQVSTKMQGEHVSVIVSDNGPGIPEEVQARIHDPFFTTKQHGNGLGLAICNQIISDHEGTIEVTSVPHTETVFRFTLPDVEIGEAVH